MQKIRITHKVMHRILYQIIQKIKRLKIIQITKGPGYYVSAAICRDHFRYNILRDFGHIQPTSVLTLLSSIEKPQLVHDIIPDKKLTQGEGDRVTENDILFSANVTNDLSTRKHMTPSPPPLELNTRN